jgi:hypothetical protein
MVFLIYHQQVHNMVLSDLGRTSYTSLMFYFDIGE